MTILDRYIALDVLKSWIAVAIILYLIVVGGIFGDQLGNVAKGSYPASLLFNMVALKSISVLNILLPFSLFLGVLLALGRLYRDSEMMVMSACGQTPHDMMRPLWMISIPAAIGLLIVSTLVAPWASSVAESLRMRAANNIEISGFQAGKFYPLSRLQGAFYFQSLDKESGDLNKVFVHASAQGEKNVISAELGRVERDRETGQRFLVLFNGKRIEGAPDSDEIRLLKFKRNDILLATVDDTESKLRTSAIPSGQLVDSSDLEKIAEFQWRLSSPFTVLVLMVFALPLSQTSPREGRFGRVSVGILVFVLYNNLLGVARVWVEDGFLPVVPGIWLVHIVLLTMGILWLIWSHGYRRRRQWRE